MSVWDYLFEKEKTTTREQTTATEEAESVHRAVDNLFHLKGELADARAQIDRLQLVCEALVNLLELRGGIARKELSLMIQRLDLADGVEDNRLGPDRSAEAPKCAHCRRPVNPRRSHCIYCFAPISGQPAGAGATSGRTVECSMCGRKVQETAIYFDEQGLTCEKCHET